MAAATSTTTTTTTTSTAATVPAISDIVPYNPGHRVKEFRIPLPLTLEEYTRGQLFMVLETTKQATADKDDGVELLVMEAITDPVYGTGRYTFKRHHLGSKIPSFLAMVLPTNAQIMEEHCWQFDMGYVKTVVGIPYLQYFSIVIETRILEDLGETDNACGLPEDKLKIREVVVVDICEDPSDAKNYSQSSDPKYFEPANKKYPQLLQSWLKDAREGRLDVPKLCVYKAVQVTFNYTGTQKKGETSMLEMQSATFHSAHQKLWCGLNTWSDKTLEELRTEEKEVFAALTAAAAEKTAAPSK